LDILNHSCEFNRIRGCRNQRWEARLIQDIFGRLVARVDLHSGYAWFILFSSKARSRIYRGISESGYTNAVTLDNCWLVRFFEITSCSGVSNLRLLEEFNGLQQAF
jgi:hypothetical protein